MSNIFFSNWRSEEEKIKETLERFGNQCNNEGKEMCRGRKGGFVRLVEDEIWVGKIKGEEMEGSGVTKL